jgi:hypothetical protein
MHGFTQSSSECSDANLGLCHYSLFVVAVPPSLFFSVHYVVAH